MIIEPLTYAAIALVLTILVEWAVWQLVPMRLPLKTVILINVLTNPAMNYLLYGLRHLGWFNSVFSLQMILIEIVVVLIEWKLVEFATARRSWKILLYSALANGASYGVGLILICLNFFDFVHQCLFAQ